MKRTLRLVGDDEVLTEREAEIALAIATTGSFTEAARFAGVDRRTIARNLDKPAVAREVARLRRGQLTHAVQRLCGLADTAIDALREVLTSPDAPHASKVAAAREVLTRAESMKNEVELRERLERLESQAERARGVR